MSSDIVMPDQWGPEQFRGMKFGIDDLALLRRALKYLKDKHALSWNNIEIQASIPMRRVRRFVTTGSRPEDPEDLVKMAKWVESMLVNRTSPITRALKAEVTITYEEVKRVWRAYTGAWICLSEAEAPGHFHSMALTISSAPERHDSEDYPLPRFALDLGDDDTVHGGEGPLPHPVEGYIQLRDDDLYFIGQSLWEPRGRFGFMVFADRPASDRRDLMAGWALLPTLDRLTPKPRRLAATRLLPDQNTPIPVGRLSEAKCESELPNFPGLLQRLLAR